MKDQNKTQPTESEIEGGKIVEKKHTSNETETGEKGPKIKKGKVDSLTIYEVTEGELETIERGSPNSTFFNIGIALLTTASSFLVTLFTVELSQKPNLFIVFTLITIVGFIVGGILMILWWRTKNDVDIVLKRIKDRMEE